MILQKWLNDKLKEISCKLPMLVLTNPTSFSCGFNTGYKQAMLDLERVIEEGAEIYRSKCECGDKYHESGVICL
jgi:hypothetical protein